MSFAQDSEVSETILFLVACVLTAITLFALGALSVRVLFLPYYLISKARFTILPWWKSGLLYLLIGAVAAASSYFIGWGVTGIVKGGFLSTISLLN